ncbi:glycosyltransferase family 2 protein [Jannaschia ovalis]|uniref:Glycosyltransferase family 2 protein n=1 Tax=Jannaschia ovalis TaxID=3038773 RepID=A0ABY8LBZ1_9RHOB|nr:glycosyltransferase family 2 protein [Jannaschia sp. GRR-S6-38]WGH78849.1 glycosyltransferase family 2 protein [Jannaschia sp. GRR-S6-38]
MIHERRLAGTTIGALRVIELLADGETFRLFLGAGANPKAIRPVPGTTPERVQLVGGALIVRGTLQGAVLSLPMGDGPALPAPSAPEPALRAPSAPEPALLAGRRVLMGQRNGETPELVADWLRYHAETQGADAALIVDRTRPGEAPLTDALRAMDAVPGMAAVVVVTSPVPLGRGPSERHPITAPDAPGKDRMTVPADDDWTAPLSEMALWEALRWRFLTEARAVAFLDVSDLLAPASPGRRAFDLIEGAEPPVVPLLGRRVFPWRIRKGRAPAFGDHVCDQFDNPRGNRRWVADPRRVPEEEPFRLVRVGGLKPDPLKSAFFLRCMGARVNEDLGLPLAPKAGLVVDDDLLALARDGFAADPILPPVSQDKGGAHLPASVPGRTAIVTCMKNEGPFILEWIAYHRAIGVDDFLIYTNDCTDGTDRMLDLLQAQGIVQHRENPFREMEDMKPQHAALAAAESEPVMARAGWAICMDVDEFISVHAGDGHLRDLYAAVGDANMISLTWRLFGNADLESFEDASTLARFDRCAPELIRKPHQAWGFKTLFRNVGTYKKMGVHRPKGLRPDLWEQISWVNGSGQPMPKEMLRTGWRSTLETYGYDLVTLNHYAVRDAESFLVKRDRGRVNHVERDQGLGYWFRMNNNAERDTAIQRMIPAMAAELEALRALPGVAAQHAACVAAHRARIAELKATEGFAAIYDELRSERMRRLSRMHAHFGANVFLAGPDAVPDAVAMADHPEDFFFTVGEVEETAH